MKTFLSTLFLVFFAVASPLLAQDAPHAADIPAGQPKIQFNFEQAEIRLVTELVGKITGKKFILPDSLSGKVSILTQEPIPVDEVYPIYLSMLEASGYTVRPMEGNVYQLTALRGGEALASGVTKVIRLHHVNAVEVKKAIEPLVRGGREGALEVFVPGNLLILTDTEANVARIETVVEELDKVGTGSTIEVVELKNAAAEDVAEQLRAILGGTVPAGKRVQQHMQQVTGGNASLPDSLSVVAVPQANRLVITGPPRDVADLQRIVERMDVENPNGFGRLNAIFLKYLSAEEAAKSLNALFARTAEKETTRRSIGIEPSIANSALLVDASPQDFEYVRRLVERLDVVPQQVMVEVLIAEVNFEDGLDLGVEWFGIDATDEGGSGVGAFGRTRYGDNDSLMGILSEGAFPGGLALGIMHGIFTAPDGTEYNQVPFYLRAAAATRDLKILSNIPLWAQNNMEASVSVVENIPILSSSVEGSGSDRDYIQNIERMDVGIKLKLTPHVNPQNEIQLDLNPSIESIVDDASSSSATYTPTISKSEVNTTITIPDRTTVVISGLIRDSKTEVVSKVPFLGDIPLLGFFFRSTSEKTVRKNLLIFVTPRIVTDPQMAQLERARLERNASLTGAVQELEIPILNPEDLPAAEVEKPEPAKKKSRKTGGKKK